MKSWIISLDWEEMTEMKAVGSGSDLEAWPPEMAALGRAVRGGLWPLLRSHCGNRHSGLQEPLLEQKVPSVPGVDWDMAGRWAIDPAQDVCGMGGRFFGQELWDILQEKALQTTVFNLGFCSDVDARGLQSLFRKGSVVQLHRDGHWRRLTPLHKKDLNRAK